MLFAPDRTTEPPASRSKTCQIFGWMGQSFENCENSGCGRPLWDHLYEPPFGGDGRPLFHIRQYQPWRDAWVWAAVGKVITREQADACRARWGGYNAARLR